jgi:hypothetical protein
MNVIVQAKVMEGIALIECEREGTFPDQAK